MDVRTEPKRLIDLSPNWVRDTDGLIYGIRYNCPCERPHRVAPGQEDTHCPVWYGVVPTKTNWLGEPQSSDSAARGWDLTGDSWETITLTPSIHHVGHWHGFLTNGVLASC